jgi:uncharacterized protein (TIGR03437 family)
VTAYLTTRIGAGTTVSNQIATTTVTGTSDSTNQATIIFSGLNLNAGNYYLTLTSPATTPAANTPRWYTMVTTPGPHITNIAGGFTGLFEGVSLTPAPYLPASTFTDQTSSQQTGSPGWDALLFDITQPQNSVLPAATTGTPYTVSFTATGGNGSYTWSAQGPPGALLPGWLSMNQATGVLSGTPPANGRVPLTVTATDVQGNPGSLSATFDINIADKVLTANIPAGMAIVNVSGTQDLAGHANGDLTWRQPLATQPVEYTLPPGTYTFRTINPTDASSLFPGLGRAQIDSMWTAWTYNTPWITSWLAFNNTSLTHNLETQLFSGSDGAAAVLPDPPTAYADALSNGYENSLYPLIRTATPQKTWYFGNTTTLVFAVPDDQGSDNQGGVSVLIAPLASQALNITTSTLTNGQTGVAYTLANMAATGGYGSYSWTATGLPPGLTLSSAGSLSGTPTQVGPYNVTLTVMDLVSGLAFTPASPMAITIAAPNPPLSMTTTTLPAGETGISYSATVVAAGGFGTSLWSVSNGAPLSINPTSGVLTSAGPLGSGNLPQFTVTVTNADGESVSRNFTVTVNSGVTISTSSIPSAGLNESYAFQLAATGGSGGYTWTISPGSLPAGLTLASNGLISGKPTAAGTVTPTLNVTDSASGTTSRALNMTVTQNVGYAVVNRAGNLISVGGDSSLGIVSQTAPGYDVALEPAGNFIVANVTSLTRVTPAGATSTLATTSSASWIAATVDDSENIIAADNRSHRLWLISPDGLTQIPGAAWSVQAPGTAEDVKILIDHAGNYIVAHDNGGTVHIVQVTRAGSVADLPLSGQAIPTSVGGLAFDAAGNYMLLDANAHAIFQITSGGVVSTFASGLGSAAQQLGLARNAMTGEYLVSATDGTIQKVSADGSTVSPFVANGNFLTHPEGIVVVPGDYPAREMSTAPLGYFRLETASGTSEINNYTYTMANGTTVATAGAPIGNPSNNFASFDGSGTSVVNTSLNGGITTAGTIVAWVNLASGGQTRYIAGESQSGNDFDLQFTNDNVLRFYTTNGGANISYTPDPATLVGQWHMVVATFDNTSGERDLYWDGARVVTDTVVSLPNKTTQFQIGSSSPTFGGRNFFGGIDEVGVWNYALGPEQIYAMFATRGSASGAPINSISPTTAPVNSAATNVTVSGIGFAGNATVRFTAPNGFATTLTPTSITPQQLVVTLPASLLTVPGTAGISVSQAAGVPPSNQLPFSITGTPAPLSINPSQIPDLTVNAPYSTVLTGSGGSGQYSWQITQLDDGVNLTITPNGAGLTATLSGSADTEFDDGTRVTVRLTDTSTSVSVSRSYFPNVNAAPAAPPAAVPSGTTAWVLNSDGSLIAVSGTVGVGISPGFDCQWCYDMSRDAAGNFIIAAGDRIRRITPNGTSAGSDIIANDGSFYASVAVDSGGNYVVVDNGLHQVTRMPPTQPSGVPGTLVYAYPVGTTDNYFEDAYVRIDSAGNYILAEDNSVNSLPLFIFRISPDGLQHAAIPIHPAVANGRVPTSVGGMTFDTQGNYVIVDWAGSPEGVYTITPAGAASPLFTDTNAVLDDPEGISRDPVSGRYFLVDDDTNALYTFNADGSGFATVLSDTPLFDGFPGSVLVVNDVPQGTTDYVLQSNATIVPIGPGTGVSCDPSVCTGNAYDFAADASGNFIITSGNALAKVTQAGTTTLIAHAPDNSVWVSVAVDAAGNYIVDDDGVHQLVKVTPAGVVTPIASYPITNVDFEEDAVVRIDSAGNYILAHDNGTAARVFRITPAGNVTEIALSGGVPATVGGLTLDTAGNYVISDFNSAVVYAITPTGVGTRFVLDPTEIFETPEGIFRDAATGRFLLIDNETQHLYSISSDGSQIVSIADGLNDPITVISVSAASPLTITTSTLPAGTQGQAYSFGPLTATGASGGYHWSATGLPSGLAISLAGVISGTPASNAAPQSTVVVTAADAINANLTATRSYQLIISGSAPPPPPPPSSVTISSSTSSVPTKVGGSVAVSFTANSGTPPYSFTASSLPSGVTFGSASLGGSPAQTGTFTVTVTVTDAQHTSAQTSVTINVLGLTTTSLPGGTAGQLYTAALGATGGSAGYSFSGSGLPPGLSLSTDGTITGTPTTTGTSNFAVTVASGGVSVSGSLSLVIARPQPLSLGSTTLPDGTIDTPYSQPLTARGGLPPYTWSLISGALSGGLSMSGSGVVSGTPTAPGSVSFGAQVTDTAGATATGTVILVIRPAPLTITTQSLPSGMTGVDYPAQLLAASGGVSPYTWSTGNGNSLPGGMTFAADGSLRGVPSSAGSYSLAAIVTDAAGTKTNAVFPLTIRPSSADLILTASALQFSLRAPATTVPDAQTVGVQSTVPAQSIAYTYAVNPPAPWLNVTGGSSTPDTLQVSITPAALSLSSGDYQTTLSTTCTSTACNGHKLTVLVDLAVTNTPPKLQIGTTLLSFATITPVGGPLSQSISIQNAGGGSIGFASVTCEDAWCTVGQPPANLSGGASTTIPVTVDPAAVSPGFHRTLVDIVSSAGRGSVPVTLFVAPSSTMTLAPAGQQFNMPAGSAPGNPGGSFLVSVNSSNTAHWTAAVQPGAAWLVLGTASGTSTSTQPGSVSFSIDPAAAGALAPGAWYGLIRVTSPDLNNSPQDFEVILNVVPATSPLVPELQPGGLLFISSGGALPPQTVNVYSGSTSPLTFQTSAATSDGGNWLSVTPGTGSASAGSPGVVTASVSTNGLKAGVYHGGVSFSLSATAVRTVNVTLIVASVSVASEPGTSLTRALSPRATCVAARLAPAQTGLVNNFSQPAAWPTPLAIQLSDDCGGLVPNGQIVATFSNGDPPLVLPLVDPSRGLYSGTWSPRRSGSQISINVRASAPGLPDAVSQISGAVTPNLAPSLTPHGALHSFDPLVGGSLAPGTIIQIYGENLASTTAQPSAIPLPNDLNGTQVIIGGAQAPLYYVSSGQINAQIPFELEPGKQYQVLVSANGALTTPDTLQLSDATPGLAAFVDGTLIAQHGDGTLVSNDSPAKAGEYLVAYGAGMGGTNATPASGTASPTTPLAVPNDAPTLMINGTPSPLLFAGLTPGLVGLYQLNFQVPAGLPAGNITISVTQNGLASNATVLPYAP